VHSAAIPPEDVTPVGQAAHASSVVVAPVASEYVFSAHVLSEHVVTFPPTENVPFGQTLHPSSIALALLAVSVNCPAGQF